MRRLAGLDPRIGDAALAVLFAGTALGWYFSHDRLAPMGAFLLVATLPLVFRRQVPLAAFVVQIIGALLAFETNSVFSIAACMVGAYTLGVHSRHRWLSVLAVLVASSLIALELGHGELPPVPPALLPFILLIPSWLIGGAIRVPVLRADAMRERALRLEREREAAVAEAAAAERARIARELHDVVAHSVSVMVVQAGAARQVLPQSPEAAGESLMTVEATGREALTELRHLLELLNDEGDEPSLAPQPGVDQLEALVGRMTTAGQPVALRTTGTPQHLSPGLDLIVYRIIQEALTNALKYAAGARTEVLLAYGDQDLTVEVLDEGEAPPSAAGNGAGRGLIGIRQRVALYGGELEACPRAHHGFAVRARLPLRRA
jgi:signal transduction histidine kinase